MLDGQVVETTELSFIQFFRDDDFVIANAKALSAQGILDQLPELAALLSRGSLHIEVSELEA